MYLERDDHLIFHGCVPCDEFGGFLPRRMDPVVRRWRGGRVSERSSGCGAARDREAAATARSGFSLVPLERAAIAALWQGSHRHAGARLSSRISSLTRRIKILISRSSMSLNSARKCCANLASIRSEVLIVNGHVPVKIEKGESPLKRSGKAHHDRRRVFRSVRGSWLHAGDGIGTDAAGAAPPFRVGGSSHPGRCGHRAERHDHSRMGSAPARGGHRAREGNALYDAHARAADPGLPAQPDAAAGEHGGVSRGVPPGQLCDPRLGQRLVLPKFGSPFGRRGYHGVQ